MIRRPPRCTPLPYAAQVRPGPQGPTGATGANGTNGATWRDGTGAPDNNVGVDGDFYLHTTTDRKSVVEGKGVDLGGGRTIKKKKNGACGAQGGTGPTGDTGA